MRISSQDMISEITVWTSRKCKDVYVRPQRHTLGYWIEEGVAAVLIRKQGVLVRCIAYAPGRWDKLEFVE